MKTGDAIFFALGAALFTNFGCIESDRSRSAFENELASEVDSATPRVMNLDIEASGRALQRVDTITRVYLAEAVQWANRQSQCSSRCMAFIVAETLAASGTAGMAERKLEQIRRGEPYRRWGTIPQVPGWRGYFGAIEPLISKGRTTDGRFSMAEGIVRLPLSDSIFSQIAVKDSPGSFLEVGALLPYELDRASPWLARDTDRESIENNDRILFLGSDKFGHFLSTGYEYLEAYLETFDESLAAQLSGDDAAKRAYFAALVRGLLTEATSLGGWTSRVFSYGDLAANYAGFRFFKDIVDLKSSYFSYDAQAGKWKLTDKAFSWRDWIDPLWDEGINCSYYHSSILGDNNLQQQIFGRYLKYQKETGKDLSCPVLPPLCKQAAKAYMQKEPTYATTALVSPTCRR